MGRAKQAEQTATNGQGQTITGAIVHALTTLGVKADTAAVKGHIQQHFPSIDVKAASFDSTLSLKRKNLREGTTGRKSTKRAKPVTAVRQAKAVATMPAPSSSLTEPTLTELLRIKELAEKQGGVDALLQVIESIRGAAREAGGLDRLSQGLDALRKLTAK